MDLLIGVHAATTASVLVTHDGIFERFAAITGISATVDWATDL
jgi:predicted nucleic acid-binding protein